MNGGLLVDTGYFIALHSKRDEHNATAKQYERLLEVRPVVLPWPVLYETINTRFAKRPHILKQIDVIIEKKSTRLLDDSPYRAAAYAKVLQTSPKRPLSLVDAVLRAVIEDASVQISTLLTFQRKGLLRRLLATRRGVAMQERYRIAAFVQIQGLRRSEQDGLAFT